MSDRQNESLVSHVVNVWARDGAICSARASIVLTLLETEEQRLLAALEANRKMQQELAVVQALCTNWSTGTIVRDGNVHSISEPHGDAKAS